MAEDEKNSVVPPLFAAKRPLWENPARYRALPSTSTQDSKWPLRRVLGDPFFIGLHQPPTLWEKEGALTCLLHRVE